MLNIKQFRELIVQSSLNDLLMYSADAEELMVFTCAVESNGGTYIHQVGGPALGIYQMEPVTHNDIWQNYIMPHGSLAMMMFHNFKISSMPSEEMLIYDLRYATAMTRIFYRRIAEALPSCDDVDGIWDYYKTYYNTEKGAATKDDSISRYRDFVQYQR